jgi:hypothetical protein
LGLWSNFEYLPFSRQNDKKELLQTSLVEDEVFLWLILIVLVGVLGKNRFW